MRNNDKWRVILVNGKLKRSYDKQIKKIEDNKDDEPEFSRDVIELLDKIQKINNGDTE